MGTIHLGPKHLLDDVKQELKQLEETAVYLEEKVVEIIKEVPVEVRIIEEKIVYIEKPVIQEIEKIVEVIKEVPVYIEKEIEIIKEIPVYIDKEIEVIKEKIIETFVKKVPYWSMVIMGVEALIILILLVK